MGGWLWDSSASRCCTSKYDTSITTAPKSQTVYRKGASSATVTIYNQQNASNKACCTNSNAKGGHTRFNWTDKNYAGNGGYCWLDDSELCQTQTDKASTYGKDFGMGGWAWDSSSNRCCTSKYDTNIKSSNSTQTKYTKGGSSATVSAYNQQNDSNNFCCTNSNTKGGHTRFNWTANNYASSGGYCWLNDAELCQSQTDASRIYGKDYGMGGWLWDNASNSCCTIKTTSNQPVLRKGGSLASVNVKNQSSSSNKNCCTSTETKGGHTRFNWTANNYAGKGGYCWLDDAELCQSQTGLADYGMGGWLWDSTNNVCCTVKTTSAQTKYVKGGSSASVNVKNQSNDSTRQCCTSTQTKGGHTNTFWSSTTSKDNAGYCWNSKADFCKSTLSAGLKGWDYDSTNNQCCTNDTTTNSSYWNSNYYSAMTKKDQGSYSTEYCCTSTSTSNGHTNFNWINSKCWNSNSSFCTDTIANKGANGWYQDGSNCCTNSKTGTETVKGKGGSTSTITYKNNSDNSTAECCRKRGSNTRAYWLNSYCWSTLDEYCKSTNSSGARGYYSYTSSGTNYCCTNNKSGSLSGKNNGSSYSVTYKGNSAGAQTTKECCVNATSGAKTYINNRCWNNLNGYCTTSSSSGGAGGYYQYGSNCCVASGSESSVTTYGGSSASSSSTLYIKNENSTKTCCHNKTGTTWYSTSSETGGTCCTNDNGSKACCESSQNGHTAGTWSESAKTCCFDADVSEACCKAIKGSDAYMAGGKCCASKDQSASCCQGFCGDAYNYKNNSCTCVTCEDGEYIPEDSSGNVLAAKCCTSKNDDKICCTAANAPGNTSGNYFYATTMCCGSGNTSAECCAKYASNSGKSRFGYYDSRCVLLDSNEIYVCAVFNTSKFSSVAVGPTAVIRASGGCTGISGTSADVVITGAGTGVSNRYGGTNVSGDGCSFLGKPQDSPYNGAGKVQWSSTTANGNYTCVLAPYGDDCSGWYESASSTVCCTSDNKSSCCTSSLNPSGAGTWASSGAKCCYSATVDDACCKAMNNSNYYLAGSTCCASGNSSSACCTSSSNPKGAGKKYVASGSVCCYSESDSDACCKAIKGSSYSLYGSTCSTEEPCSGWKVGSTCCTSDNNKTCCEASNNPDGAGTWASSTCCHDANASAACCTAMKGSNYEYKNGRCVQKGSDCSGWKVGSTCCTSDSTKICCEASNNPDGAGTWVNDTSTAYYDPQNTLIALNIPDAVKMNGKVLNYSPAPLFAQPAYAAVGCSFEIKTSGNYKTATVGAFTPGTHSGLLCGTWPDKDVTLECTTGKASVTTSGQCTFTQTGTSTTGDTTVLGTLSATNVTSGCTVTMTCDSKTLNFGDISFGGGEGGDDDGGSTAGTCCHDKNASSKCCLAMSDDNYWYDGTCYTVSSGLDIYAEYGSGISGVTIAGTSVSNKNKVHVSSGSGTAIVATPASGYTFSSWSSTNCTLASASSASTTISGVTSGAKFCLVEPTAIAAETGEFTIAINTSGIVSTDKYSYCINSPDDNDKDRYCNDNSLHYAIEGDSAVNLPAGTYKFVVASKGNDVPDLTAYFGDNLTATATGDCTLTPDGNYSYNGKHYYKKWTLTSTGACTIKPHSNAATSDTTIVIGEENCTVVAYTKEMIEGSTKKSCDKSGNTVALGASDQFTLEYGKGTVLCCLITSDNVVRNYYYDAPDGGLYSYPAQSPKSGGSDGVYLSAKCLKAGGCTVTVNIGRKITYKPSTKIIGCGDQGFDSYNVGSVPSGKTADIIPNLIDGYEVRDIELSSSCKDLKITGKYLKQKPPFITVKSTCNKPESEDPAAATCECKVCTYTNLNSGGKKTTMTVDGDSVLGFSTGTKPYTVDMPLGTGKTFASNCGNNYIFKGWSCSGEGYTFNNDNGASEPFFNVRATDCGKKTCIASCYGKCEYCSGWLRSATECCTAEDSKLCCETNLANSAGHTAGKWDATNNKCCHSDTESDGCCKAYHDSTYSLSGGTCSVPTTEDEWLIVEPEPSSCATSGSAEVQLSSSAPSGCLFYVDKYSSTPTNTSPSIPVTTSPQTFSSSVTLKVNCSSGHYAPTIMGTCCAFGSCSTSGNSVSCSFQYGSGSGPCTVSAESCSSGWVGNVGGCCYSDNSKSCCEAPTQSTFDGSSLHTQGSYINNECCTSAEQSQNCCKAMKGSSAVYNAIWKTCK